MNSRSRDFTVGDPNDETGTTSVWGRLSTPDAALVQHRLTDMIRSVRDDDPRTAAQRRADALGAMAGRATVLACQCGHTLDADRQNRLQDLPGWTWKASSS